jgi:hypothetical protein
MPKPGPLPETFTLATAQKVFHGVRGQSHAGKKGYADTRIAARTEAEAAPVRHGGRRRKTHQVAEKRLDGAR